MRWGMIVFFLCTVGVSACAVLASLSAPREPAAAAAQEDPSGIFQGVEVYDLVHKGTRVPGAHLVVELGAITRCRLVITDRAGNVSTAYDPGVRASTFIFPAAEPQVTSWQARTDLPPWIESLTVQVEVGGAWQTFKKIRPATPVAEPVKR